MSISLEPPPLGERERERVDEVLASDDLVEGSEVRAFEAEFAEHCGARYAAAAATGTAARHAALVGLGVGTDDRVLVAPFSAAADAVRLVGADLGFVDVDPRTFTLDVGSLADRLEGGEGVDVVVAVDAFGLQADVPTLAELAARYDFAVLEDAARAHGSTCEGRPPGRFADVACCDFDPAGPMTTGQGGMVVADDGFLLDRAARFLQRGTADGTETPVAGEQRRLPSVAAAIGRVQLRRLPAFIERRRRNAARYDAALANLPATTPRTPPGFGHAYAQYVVRVPDRDGLAAHLAALGVETGVPCTIPEDPANGGRRDLPNAALARRETLSLPVHHDVSASDVARVADAMRTYYEGDGAVADAGSDPTGADSGA